MKRTYDHYVRVSGLSYSEPILWSRKCKNDNNYDNGGQGKSKGRLHHDISVIFEGDPGVTGGSRRSYKGV